jgi:hypothetical protein
MIAVAVPLPSRSMVVVLPENYDSDPELARELAVTPNSLTPNSSAQLLL